VTPAGKHPAVRCTQPSVAGGVSSAEDLRQDVVFLLEAFAEKRELPLCEVEGDEPAGHVPERVRERSVRDALAAHELVALLQHDAKSLFSSLDEYSSGHLSMHGLDGDHPHSSSSLWIGSDHVVPRRQNKIHKD
jgi:hypothetical protein